MNRQNPLLKYWQYIVMVVLLILSILLGVDELKPSIARDPQKLPKDTPACTSADCTSPEGYRVVFQGLPEGVFAHFLPVGDEAALGTLPKDGFQCLGLILAHIAYYDDKSGDLVTQFAEPVTVQYTLTPDDITALAKCNPDISMDNLSAVVPVYLYLPTADKRVNIWKPFQNYSIEKVINPDTNEVVAVTVTIQFKYWGDPQNGIGTKG